MNWVAIHSGYASYNGDLKDLIKISNGGLVVDDTMFTYNVQLSFGKDGKLSHSKVENIIDESSREFEAKMIISSFSKNGVKEYDNVNMSEYMGMLMRSKGAIIGRGSHLVKLGSSLYFVLANGDRLIGYIQLVFVGDLDYKIKRKFDVFRNGIFYYREYVEFR